MGHGPSTAAGDTVGHDHPTLHRGTGTGPLSADGLRRRRRSGRRRATPRRPATGPPIDRPMSRPAYHPRRRRRNRRFAAPESSAQTASSGPSCTTGRVRRSTCSTWRRRPSPPVTTNAPTPGRRCSPRGNRSLVLACGLLCWARPSGPTAGPRSPTTDHPLYFYAHEGKHEVECHNVFLNGGFWYAVQPDGNAAPVA